MSLAVVVSDTSPIVALAFLNRLDLLQNLFGTVLIPPAVAQELSRPPWSAYGVALRSATFIVVRAPRDLSAVLAVAQTLHAGESEALALALEVRAEAVLMDERVGRAIAEELGLVPVGVLGVLLRAKNRGLIPRLSPLIDALRDELNFRVSATLREQVLRDAGE